MLPGLALLFLGVLGMIWLLPGPRLIGTRTVDIHVMVLAALLSILGAQTLLTGLSAKAYAYTHHFVPSDRLIETFYRHFSLERGLLVALVVGGVGLVFNLQVLLTWLAKSLGDLDAVRPALFGSTLIVLGAQTAFSSCLLAILDIQEEARRRSGMARGST
jgi:hypothetical protein